MYNHDFAKKGEEISARSRVARDATKETPQFSAQYGHTLSSPCSKEKILFMAKCPSGDP